MPIIIMLHLAWSFRPTPGYEYARRTKQMERKQEQGGAVRGEGRGGGGGDRRAPTSSSLRISDWPQVSRSCRAWDQKVSSWLRVPWQRGGLTNL